MQQMKYKNSFDSVFCIIVVFLLFGRNDFAAKRPVRKTWGKPKKTKENMFFLVFVLFLQGFSNGHLSARKNRPCRFYFHGKNTAFLGMLECKAKKLMMDNIIIVDSLPIFSRWHSDNLTEDA